MLLAFIFFVPFFGNGPRRSNGRPKRTLWQLRHRRRLHQNRYGAKVTEGTSGLFLLLGTVTADKVTEAFESALHFEIIATNLTHEQERKLMEAFA